MAERKYWLDYAKVYGMFLVVLGHFTPCYKEVYSSQLLYSFHLPLFFIISGYLFKSPNLTLIQQLKKIFVRLIVPYVLLIAIGLGLECVLRGGELFNIKELISIIGGRPIGLIDSMWFVHALIIIKVAQVLQTKLQTWNHFIYGCSWLLFLIYIIFIAYTNETIVPSPVCSILVAYPFYMLGTIIGKYEIFYDKIPKYWNNIIIFFLLLVPFLAVQRNGFVDLYLNVFGCNIILYYLFGILSSIGVLLFCRQFINYPSNIVITLSNGTMLIVAFHKFFILYLGYRDEFTIRFLFCISVILFFYFPIFFCLKYCPFLIGKKRRL